MQKKGADQNRRLRLLPRLLLRRLSLKPHLLQLLKRPLRPLLCQHQHPHPLRHRLLPDTNPPATQIAR